MMGRDKKLKYTHWERQAECEGTASHALREGRKVRLGEIVLEVTRGCPSQVHWDAGSAPA